MDYKFSHVGIPTTDDKNWDGFYEPLRIHYTEFDKDEYNIEWVKFEKDSSMHPLVQNLPHTAYYVDNMEAALAGKNIIVETFSPGEGVRVAFIEHNGAPIEFMEIKQ
ncbi:VOC family protein [Seonamhaeicola maritimus]|uniref:VOC family protein n=1 Tax=Seonamhaeicola maritimus TaxID=2591822 RepID=UPI002494F4B2|nr:hypothetical protein [Seonamhaeicola maritimus]